MKIYVQPIENNGTIKDLYDNTTNFPLVDINDIYKEVINRVPRKTEKLDGDGLIVLVNDKPILIQATDQDGTLLYDEVPNQVLKDCVVEFDVDRPLNRTDLELMRSTYWTNKIGVTTEFFDVIINDKDREIEAKKKIFDLTCCIEVEREARATHSVAILDIAKKVIALENGGI